MEKKKEGMPADVRIKREWTHRASIASEMERRKRMTHTRKALVKNEEEPALVAFREAETVYKQHHVKLKSQLVTVVDKMDDAERDVASISASHQLARNNTDDHVTTSELTIGPPLRKLTSDERVIELQEILLRGSPQLVDDSKIISHVSMFGNPLETIETVCGVTGKLTAELYHILTEVLQSTVGERAEKLKPEVAHMKKVLASSLNFAGVVRDQAHVVREKCEELEALLESSTMAKNAACRIGKELSKENETLRQQLYKTAVRSRHDNSATILEGIVSKTDSHRTLVMLQCENTHTIRLSKPKLVSEGLLLVQGILEATMSEFEGKRVNYNSSCEGREVFDRQTNPRFAPESYMIDFPKISNAIDFLNKLQLGLVEKVKWPTALTDVPDFATVMDPEDPDQVLWQGIRVRAAVHQGTPNVTFPLASSKVADNAPFFGGSSMDRLSTLLQKSRGGEALLSGPATEAFLNGRFEDPLMCPGVELHERQLGAVPGIGPNEKIRSMLPVRLKRRLRPEEKLCMNPPYQCVYPTPAFWRVIEDLEELQASAFAEDDFDGSVKRLTPYEYEEIIGKQQKESDSLKSRLEKVQDALQTVMAEAEDLKTQLDAATAEIEKQEHRVENAERRARNNHHVSTQLEGLVMLSQDELSKLRPEFAASEEAYDQIMKHLEAERLKRTLKTYEDACIGPDSEEDEDDDDSDAEKPAASSGNRRRSTRPSDDKGCMSCPVYIAKLDNVHNMAKVVSKMMVSALEGKLADKTELDTLFLGAAHRLLGDKESTLEEMLDGAVDTPSTVHQAFSICGHFAKQLQAVKGFGVIKQVRDRAAKMNSTLSVGEELEHLFDTTEKLQDRIKDMEQQRRHETGELRDTIKELNAELDNQANNGDEKVVDLNLRIKALTLKLQETSTKAQKYYSEANRLVDELQTKNITTQNEELKADFERLNKVYELKGDAQEVKRVMNEQNRHLKALTEELEERIRAKEQQFLEREAEFAKILESRTQAAYELQAKEIEDIEARLHQHEQEAVAQTKEELRREFKGQLQENHKKELARDQAKQQTLQNKEDAMKAALEKEFDAKVKLHVEARVELELQRRLQSMPNMSTERMGGDGTPGASRPHSAPRALDGTQLSSPPSSSSVLSPTRTDSSVVASATNVAPHEPLSALIAGEEPWQQPAPPLPPTMTIETQTDPLCIPCPNCGEDFDVIEQAQVVAQLPVIEGLETITSFTKKKSMSQSAKAAMQAEAERQKEGSGVGMGLEALVAMTTDDDQESEGSFRPRRRSTHHIERAGSDAANGFKLATSSSILSSTTKLSPKLGHSASAASSTKHSVSTPSSRPRNAGPGLLELGSTPSGIVVYRDDFAEDLDEEDPDFVKRADGTSFMICSRRVQVAPNTADSETNTVTEEPPKAASRRGSAHISNLQRLKRHQSSALSDPGDAWGSPSDGAFGESPDAFSQGFDPEGIGSWADSAEQQHPFGEEVAPSLVVGGKSKNSKISSMKRAGSAAASRSRPSTTKQRGGVHPALALVQRRPSTASIGATSATSGTGLMMTSGGAVERLPSPTQAKRATSPRITSPLKQRVHVCSTGSESMLVTADDTTLLRGSEPSLPLAADSDDDAPYPSSAHDTRISDAHNKAVRQSATFVRVKSPPPRRVKVRGKSPSKAEKK